MILLLALSFLCAPGRAAEDPRAAIVVRSPSGAVEIDFSLDGGIPRYRVSYLGRPVVLDSRLGIDLDPGGPLADKLMVEQIERREIETSHPVLFGKTSRATDHFDEAAVSLAEQAPGDRKIELIFRAYDDGAAFRYFVPEQSALPAIAIREELSQWRFAGDPMIYYLPLGADNPWDASYEAYYKQGRLGQMNKEDMAGLPFLLRYPDFYVGMTEAALLDYAGLYLRNSEFGFQSRLAPSLSDKVVKVRGKAPFFTPWRVLLLGRTPGDLLESNVIFNLNPGQKLEDTSWIQPGKTTFGWWNGYYFPDSPPLVAGVNTATIKRYIDFAAAHGIPYTTIDGTNDEGWYGGSPGEYRGQDMTKPVPALDMPGVIAYAKSKGVKIRLWMHRKALEKWFDKAMAQFERWGISGIMVDFINGDDQESVRFVHKVAEEAAKRHLTVNYHGVFKPTGTQRVYPNMLSFEGVMGTEYNKWDKVGSTPEHEMLTFFVRMMAGPLDNHQGSFHPVVPEKFAPNNFPSTMGTLTRQLAEYIVCDNPLPLVADSPSAYEAQPAAFAFVSEVPTTWDETKVLQASVGEYLAIARRSGKDWYVGAVGDRKSRSLDIPLSFLGQGQFIAKSYSDARDADEHPEKYDVTTRVVTSGDVLRARLARAGGLAVRLTPIP